MGVALVGLVGGVLPWILAWFALGGNAKSVETNIEHFGAAVTEGPVNTAVGAYKQVAIFTVVLGGAVLAAEIYATKKAGIETGPLPLTPVAVPPPPVFGASGGLTGAAGPIAVSQGVSAGPGAPAPARRPPMRRRSGGFGR